MSNQIHLDRETLYELKEVMEDEFVTLIDTYLDDSSHRIGTLQEALLKENFDELCKAAHSFKGSSGNIGALYLAELCRQLEEQSKSEEIPLIRATVVQINEEFEQVKSSITQFSAS